MRVRAGVVRRDGRDRLVGRAWTRRYGRHAPSHSVSASEHARGSGGWRSRSHGGEARGSTRCTHCPRGTPCERAAGDRPRHPLRRTPPPRSASTDPPRWTPLIELNADRLDRDRLHVGHAADGRKHPIQLALAQLSLGRVEADPRTLFADSGLQRSNAGVNLDAAPREALPHDGRAAVVLQWKDPLQCLQEKDLAAEGSEYVGELAPDCPRAEDEQRTGSAPRQHRVRQVPDDPVVDRELGTVARSGAMMMRGASRMCVSPPACR
jgi:hypothetical protein